MQPHNANNSPVTGLTQPAFSASLTFSFCPKCSQAQCGGKVAMFHKRENVARHQHPNFHSPPSVWVAVSQLSIGEMGRMSPAAAAGWGGEGCPTLGESVATSSSTTLPLNPCPTPSAETLQTVQSVAVDCKAMWCYNSNCSA